MPFHPTRRVVLGAAAALATPFVRAQAPIVIKFSHVVAVGHAEGQRGQHSRSSPKSAPRAASRSRSIPTASSTRTRKNSKRCSSARCKCWRRRWPSSARWACANSKCSTCLTSFDKLRRTAQGHRGPDRQAAVEEARAQGHHRPGLLGQRLQGHERQQAAAHAGRLQGPENAHPVVEGAGRADARAGRQPAGDGVLRGLPGAADRRRRRHGESAVEHLHAENARSAEVRDAVPTTATSATRSSSTRNSGTACRRTSAPCSRAR